MRITELGQLLQIPSKEDRVKIVTFSVDFIAWLKEGEAFDVYLVLSGEIMFHLCGIADKQCACLGC